MKTIKVYNELGADITSIVRIENNNGSIIVRDEFSCNITGVVTIK